MFIRPDNNVVIMCNNTKCFLEDKFDHKYSGMVDSPSQRTLTMKFFEPDVDAGEWKCMDILVYGVSSSCVKTDARSITYSDCAEPGIEGQRTTISCCRRKGWCLCPCSINFSGYLLDRSRPDHKSAKHDRHGLLLIHMRKTRVRK
ncbi:uncharacterized protein LOC121386597 [Gigantopelta aegis]|uniref:uncharacterized protein LOC121386597 n=1 Tax=Gigantopelta aegis TaxID=1735272 RepID=UPI001B88DA77|nr:uncharacterized protein LOC121386597 [Gigantopelta aegis]